MSLFWKDILNDQEEWLHLEFTIEDQVKPKLRLESGLNNIFKLTDGKDTYFWGKIENNYYGAWLLRNENAWTKAQMPVQPINSATTQQAEGLNKTDRYCFWSRYFAQALSTSKNRILYPGKWILSAKLDYERLKRRFIYSEEEMKEKWKGFYDKRPVFLDWGFDGSFLTVALKAEPDALEGRVKWWRKQVRQDTCPPVLVWFISSLQAYVIIDGHSRLKAFHLERKKPDILVLESVIEYARKPNLERAEAILENLKARQNHRWKQPLSVDQVNRLLIEVFDDRPFTSTTTTSLGKPELEQLWLKELRQLKGLRDIDDLELEAMIKGE